MKDSALIRPIITEKSMREAQKGRFTFETAKHADKLTIKKTVEELFKVRVLSVATRIVKGKSKRFGKKMKQVRLTEYKKATVRLAPGQKISLFEATGEIQ